MTRSVYTLCVFQNLNPVGFCVICAFCGELQAKEMLSEEWKVKSEKSNGLREEWRTKSEESNGLSEEWKVKSEESNGLSEERRVKNEESNS